MLGRNANIALLALSAFAVLAAVNAEVFFEENFDAGWEDRWVLSQFKASDEGKWVSSAGKYYGDADNKGIQTSTDMRWYDISAKTPTFDNKDKTLVLQYTVKHEQNIDCGGGYIKLAPATVDQTKFGGDTEYQIMFGPDVCGYSTKRVHVIFTYKGKNNLIKREIKPETDELTHIYTLIVNKDNTYEVKIDNKSVQTGSLYDDWDMLAAKKIKDPKASKPDDWDERPEIDDPTDIKPEGYDDIPKTIVDPEATKPDDWDDESDGEWEAPTIDNPEYKGPWKAKKIKNEAYKGIWVAPDIDNPDFVDDLELYNVAKGAGVVGFELWQVKAGSIFDNILICDDPEYAKAQAEKILPLMKKEKEAKEAGEKKEKEEAEAKAKASEAASAGSVDDEDEDDDDDEPAKKEEL